VPERYLGRSLGKYRVDALVGSGGFAWVYKAYDPELDIPIAVKVLKPQFAGDSVIEQRFRREASTAAKLRHPNIIKIFAVGREGDAVYFAMDFLPNGLADRLESVNVLPEEFVLRMGIDVASALGFAHREGVIHRDIKVDNILFDAHGNAVVADFGIARALTGYVGETGTNMVVGTPQYFAPEQARAKPLDGRADIYSLGVTLYRAATGRLPFDGDDWYEIARQHVEDTPPAPRSINAALSAEFETILMRCLEKAPDERPANAETLSQSLAQLLGGTLEHSALRSRMSSGGPTLIVSPAKRRRRIAPLWIALGVAAAGTVVGIPVLIALSSTTNTIADTATMAAAPIQPIDTAAPSPIPLPDTARKAAVDSVVSVTMPDSTRLRQPARLEVSAPEGASILVNGIAVGVGSWKGDTLKRGKYDVSATVGSPQGCETATDRRSVMLIPGPRPTRLTMTPRSCGLLNIDATPSGGHFTLVSTSGDSLAQGVLPLTSTLVIPAGSYKLTIERKNCSAYNEDLTIVADRPLKTRPIRLFCPQG
jgi:eukaryotic-like serine/threonine-protein kinase